MSAQQIITEHLDLWAGAVTSRSTSGRGSNGKIELTGIKKLRELILELAVRGKLVPQNPDDEPATVFLEQVENERSRLIKEGKIKRPKPRASAVSEPFSLPATWRWVQLDDIGLIGSSSRVHQKDWRKNGIPFYRAREIVQLSKTGSVDNELFISEDLYDQLTNRGLAPSPKDVMITGVGTIGVPYVVTEHDKFYFKDASVLIFKNFFHVNPNYLFTFFRSRQWVKSIHEDSMGTTVHTLTIARANAVLLPLPPREEQHRIVEKVDELMALCDRLEQQTSDQLAAHETLVDALLDTLTRSQDAAELADNWARLAAHFDTLFTTEHSIDRLKQTILQLAVMGRLVPQDPNDEPASVLLEKIAAEKEQLVKEGKIKKPKKLAEISEEETPFEAPLGWVWARFGDVVNFRSELVQATDYPNADQVAPDSIEKATGRLLERRTVSESGVRGPNNRFYRGQILYSKIRPSLSKAIIADFDGFCSADMYPLDPLIDPKYLLRTILSEVFLEQVRAAENRIKMPKLNIESLSNIAIPLPPAKEQVAIVGMLETLTAVCDQLKARLTEAGELRTRLAEAVVEQALT